MLVSLKPTGGRKVRFILGWNFLEHINLGSPHCVWKSLFVRGEYIEPGHVE